MMEKGGVCIGRVVVGEERFRLGWVRVGVRRGRVDIRVEGGLVVVGEEE